MRPGKSGPEDERSACDDPIPRGLEPPLPRQAAGVSQSQRTTTRPTMHAFLKRHYKKSSRSKAGGGGKAKREESGPIGVLKYQDAISKSMDSLLMVVSSVPLPAEAKLSVDPSERKRRGRGRDPRSSESHSEQELPCMERRHSFDFSKFSDDEEGAASDAGGGGGGGGGGFSRSVDASPARALRLDRTDSAESRETYRALHQSFLTSLGNSASFTSEREFTDSDDDNHSFVSVHTTDSQSRVLVVAAEENEQGEVFTHQLPLPTPPPDQVQQPLGKQVECWWWGQALSVGGRWGSLACGRGGRRLWESLGLMGKVNDVDV